MITKFKLFERMGINSDISLCTDYIWDNLQEHTAKTEDGVKKYLFHELPFDVFSKIPNLLVYVHTKNKANGTKLASFNFYDTSLGKTATINMYVFKKSHLEHELTHLYQYILNNFSLNLKHLEIRNDYNSKFKSNGFINTIISDLYFCSTIEISAYISGTYRQLQDGLELDSYDDFLKKTDVGEVITRLTIDIDALKFVLGNSTHLRHYCSEMFSKLSANDQFKKEKTRFIMTGILPKFLVDIFMKGLESVGILKKYNLDEETAKRFLTKHIEYVENRLKIIKVKAGKLYQMYIDEKSEK